MDDSPTVDLLEHFPHALDVVVVQEPSLWVLLILFEGYTKGIGDVDCLPVILPQKDTDYAFIGSSRDRPRMMVCHR